jgi:hypothetical protein
MNMAKQYKLLPEHEARFPEWRDKWIANAMSTKAMTEEDRELCRVAVLGMYAAAKLSPPKHIVFVPSPFVLAFAGGFSAAIWFRFKNAATYAATLPTWLGGVALAVSFMLAAPLAGQLAERLLGLPNLIGWLILGAIFEIPDALLDSSCLPEAIEDGLRTTVRLRTDQLIDAFDFSAATEATLKTLSQRLAQTIQSPEQR